MIKFDFWDGETADILERLTSVSCTFYPNSGEYRGNLYIDNKAVGDYICTDSVELERHFPNIFE